MGSINKMKISDVTYDISPSPTGTLDTTSDVKFISNDVSQESATSYVATNKIEASESNSGIFSKITTMIRNIRFLYNKLGSTNISDIGDTVTGSIVNLKSDLDVKATAEDFGRVKIGDGITVDEGTISVQFRQMALDFIYPVGSIYLTMNDTINPGTLFGGSWTKLSHGRALVTTTSGSTSSTYYPGRTFGNSSVTLTIDQLPSHSHSYSGTTSSGGSHHHESAVGDDEYNMIFLHGTYNSPSSTRHSIARDDQKVTYRGYTSDDGSHTHTYSGSTATRGSGNSIDITPASIYIIAWKRVS